MIGENDPHKTEACTSTSSTYTIKSSSTIGDFINYSQCCFYRLPCGICTRTNSFCPLGGNSTVTPSWQPGTIVYTNGTGTVPADYIFKGETTAQMCKNTNYD